MRLQIGLCVLCAVNALSAPQLSDKQFDLPGGFHIYRAAGPELSGGSYDLTFDGQGRLLVGDGNAVRRLIDKDSDGVYDSFEVIATGLGPRGPQGLLVFGDKLYAVGGDGIQVFEGYQSSGPLKHIGRIGNKFQTGGDHDAHTIFRGHDGFLYFMAGNGAGTKNRLHITESNSPALMEREASVFRISPDGAKWECVASGGRNPPNLGMNYLGELFSFDSDMEWHVGLPWYRPARLNHWVVGGDQGWQEVGAYPPYFIDCLPGILNVGRGSPTWGVFYEHRQLPRKYQNAYLVSDYRWKRESNDQYNTSGRLVAFFLERDDATWNARIETLARPKPNARDATGKLINFALVDVDVAPDGSLFLTDHNQGIWRIYYGERLDPSKTPQPRQRREVSPLRELMEMPQPGAEWSRLREEAIRRAGGDALEEQLRSTALNRRAPISERLRALRLVAPGFRNLSGDFVNALAADTTSEIRGQAAWLIGLRGGPDAAQILAKLLRDDDGFVRRRAAEASMRVESPAADDVLIGALTDPSRTVQYAAMIALAHRPRAELWKQVNASKEPQVRMRALVATALRNEALPDSDVQAQLRWLVDRHLSQQDILDLYRVLALFKKAVQADAKLHHVIAEEVVRLFPARENIMRWEQVRLIGEYDVTQVFTKLLNGLFSESDHVTQFHVADALTRLSSGWTPREEKQLVQWMIATQRGWFADFAGKGVEFPESWLTVLTRFAERHGQEFMARRKDIDLASLPGTALINLVAKQPGGREELISMYRAQGVPEVRRKVIGALQKAAGDGATSPTQRAEVLAFARAEYSRTTNTVERMALVRLVANQSSTREDVPLLLAGFASDDVETVRAAATAMVRLRAELNAPVATALLQAMNRSPQLLRVLEPTLIALRDNKPPQQGQRVSDEERSRRLANWATWFEQQFGKKFLATPTSEKSDEELIAFLLGERAKGGNRTRGAAVYEALQCHTCHGGGVTPGREGRLFGPDLVGVTRRLSRQDFADSLVYPSKQVAERYKANELSLKNGNVFTGFVTEKDDTTITFADRDSVQRVSRAEIQSLQPQSSSLMPDHLLNRLSWDELRDLIAFLEEGAGK